MKLSVSSFALVASTLPMVAPSLKPRLAEASSSLHLSEWQQSFDVATAVDFSVTPPSVSDEAASWHQISVVVERRWNTAAKRRFKELVVSEALGTLSVEEAQELEALTVLRRQNEHPRAPEEILWDYRQQQVTAKLLEALHRYVEFHRPTRHQKAATQP